MIFAFIASLPSQLFQHKLIESGVHRLKLGISNYNFKIKLVFCKDVFNTIIQAKPTSLISQISQLNRKNGKFFRRQTNCSKQFGKGFRKAVKESCKNSKVSIY